MKAPNYISNSKCNIKIIFLNSFYQFPSFFLPYLDYYSCFNFYCFLVAVDYNYLYSITKTQKALQSRPFSIPFVKGFTLYQQSYTLNMCWELSSILIDEGVKMVLNDTVERNSSPSIDTVVSIPYWLF